jgi:hypothetical protein
MAAELPDLFEGDGFFAPDAPVGAVMADIQQIRDLVDKGEMGREMFLDVLEKDLLNADRIFHGQAV